MKLSTYIIECYQEYKSRSCIKFCCNIKIRKICRISPKLQICIKTCCKIVIRKKFPISPMLQICIKICCKNKIRKNSLYLPNYKSASEFVAKIESEKTLQICINLLQNWNRKISLFLLCYKYASKFVARIRAEEITFFSQTRNLHQNLLQK